MKNKRLTDLQLLTGQTEEITMMDLRSRPGDVMAQVQSGKTFTVTKAGKVVAVISQPEPTRWNWARKCDDADSPANETANGN
jgi:prevent-host-death family protein